MKLELIEKSDYIRYQGRICFRKTGNPAADTAVLGFTNSSVTVRFRGKEVSAAFVTGENADVNKPGLRIYLDGEAYREIVLQEPDSVVNLVSLGEEGEHELRIVKITEAAMSYAGLRCLETDGDFLPVDKDDPRKKALFIGDSITCGYGVLGAPDSEYTIREEDGELSYAAVMARKMNWNAEWVSVSGYGMFVEYTGDPENILPKVFAYQNYFYDKDERTSFERFCPDYIIMNLGTNDSGPIAQNELIKAGFISRYESFIYTLRMAYPDAAIICVLGTLAPGIFKYVNEAIERAKKNGVEKLYGLELPEHDVEHDGMASGHPSKITHEKDADRIIDFIEREKI